MANCLGCSRVRPKREPHLAADGYVECKASSDAGVILQAFNGYTLTRRVVEPFVVQGVAGHPGSAWPLQFLPDSIERCEGFVAKDFAKDPQAL